MQILSDSSSGVLASQQWFLFQIEPDFHLQQGSWWPASWRSLVGRWIALIQNGQTTINEQEIPGITGGALTATKNCRTNLSSGQ